MDYGLHSKARGILCAGIILSGACRAHPGPGAASNSLDAELRAARPILYDVAIELRAPEPTDDAPPRLRPPGRIKLGEGWSAPEAWGTWAIGTRATLLVAPAEPGPTELVLETLAFRHPRWRRDQRVRVVVNGAQVGELQLDGDMREFRVPIADGVLRDGPNRIEFIFDWGVSPARLGDGIDERRLAAGFRRIALLGPGSGAGALLVPLRRPDGVLRIEPASQPWDWAALDAGTLGCLRLDPAPAGGTLRVLVEDVRAEHRSARRVRGLPDVVVVVLDAARPDHFGCYGYARDTTPNIDRLARNGLVFREVVATASYTVASVPTMLTGLTFPHHGVELNGDILPDDAETLAEAFDALGYRTLCYSANPNHSRAAGLAQGCDEFESIWGEGGRDRWIEPDLVTDRALGRLARGTDDEPLFLLLHYVVPHEPYRPDPEFDMFGDPGYSGKASGELDVRRAIDRGERQASREDLDEIIALYDGNLREADHEVGRLLEALRGRERWPDTAVVVTSDHGEAFMEHGRMGHNSTVHEEMLRVPLILRLPGDRAPADVDTTALASLEDLLPTLVGLAGGAGADSRGTGFDLLDPHARRGDRAVLARSAGERPDYALRTARWKAIFGGARPTDWRLYDLRADPGETRDLMLERLETFTCLSAHAELALLPAADRVLRARETTDDPALRALGYAD